MNDARIFETLALAPGLTLRNRLVMSPMTTWSANDDGTVSDQEVDYYQARVKDVGLVITGCTHVQPNGVGFTGEFASYDDSFLPSLTNLAVAAKSGGAPAILQIFHTGVKTTPDLPTTSSRPAQYRVRRVRSRPPSRRAPSAMRRSWT